MALFECLGTYLFPSSFVIMDNLRELSEALDNWSQSLSAALSSSTAEHIEKHASKIESLQTACDLLYAELCEMEQALPEKDVDVQKIKSIGQRLSR